MRFTIPGVLPTANEIIAASKKHHMVYAKMKKENTALAHICASSLPKIKRADFEITWYCKDKRKDKDNITAGQKFIFDGMVEAGIIPNDGWAEIGNVSHKFEIDKHSPRVEIALKNVEG